MKKLTIILAVTALVLASCRSRVELGPNPFVTHIYTADPSGHVWQDGRLYVYASHDIDPPRGCDSTSHIPARVMSPRHGRSGWLSATGPTATSR